MLKLAQARVTLVARSSYVAVQAQPVLVGLYRCLEVPALNLLVGLFRYYLVQVQRVAVCPLAQVTQAQIVLAVKCRSRLVMALGQQARL